MKWFFAILAIIMVVLSFWGKTDEEVRREEEYEQLIIEKYESSVINSRDSVGDICQRDRVCVSDTIEY